MLGTRIGAITTRTYALIADHEECVDRASLTRPSDPHNSRYNNVKTMAPREIRRARIQNVLLSPRENTRRSRLISGAVIAHSSRGTHASGFYVDDAPTELDWSGIVVSDSRWASSTYCLSLWQSVFSEFCAAANHTHNVDSEGAHHQLINGYTADKCTHSARSAAHHTCALIHTTCVQCFYCPCRPRARLVRVCATVRCWRAFLSFSRPAACLCCFPLARESGDNGEVMFSTDIACAL